MSEHEASLDVAHDDGEEEEQVDLDGEVEPEEMVDEEVEDVVDVEEDDKLEGQEGLDLDMPEEEGIGDQDEPYAEHENGVQKHGKADGGESIEAMHTEEHASQQEAGVEQKDEKDADKNAELLLRPPHGSEVFVGGITRDTTEDDLRELCVSCGDVYEARVLKDKETGQNKGYAFVTFTTRESAEKAIETLGDSELKGKKLRFSQSQSKHRLFIGNVPKVWDKPELEKILIDQGPGVESVELLKDPNNPARNRGFAFVDYYNHACAENARKVLSRASFRLASNVPTVSWADPRSGLDTPAAMAQVKVVYVRNLPDTVTEEQLKSLFERHGEVTRVVLPAAKPGQMKRDFGFVHFSDRSSALKALEKTETYELEGRVLETSLAKPPPEKRNVGADLSYSPQRAGVLPHSNARGRYSYGANIYGMESSSFGGPRGYNQPVIYGRGPPPAGMTMVPMMLPDGRVGYVFQQPGAAGVSQQSRGGRSGHGASAYRGGGSGTGGSRRYRPY
ncbi:hypothetical protein O6H91_16G043400 [Diphasiastrum complanatum]|uniref:Uncharacterized protein n=8 Tax=Diphasiastrum complanatum TaxID=34168 RepID=A0ACC2BBV4_DIPCM|nr:hypothetical protein O6H91_16G025600 [Diphasiastrum complanatum]KAJ7526847.1 hypothetical protein O6H91_16G025600 [Diphasiastrum complanatum]KAJ7526849.1 hypothetical protein O6H91_16G025600 [Diphasiastrum complanatum]KAJ7526850.1 hypothetical protein O6H91_16G025600 [Diphasiastrum complanatum]KAJ7526853.1 hypothetical protein O6H91_16G025600 [Diphasiastrum complanatum]